MSNEVEAFDTGHLWYAKQLVADGVLEPDVLVQLCMGVPWGAPDDLNTFMAMVNNVPDNWTFSAFSLGRNQMAYVAASVLAGGNVRVGLEDNLWLDMGVLATNDQLVARAKVIIENLGARVIGPQEVRDKLGLTKRAPGLGRGAERCHYRWGQWYWLGYGPTLCRTWVINWQFVMRMRRRAQAKQVLPQALIEQVDVRDQVAMDGF